MTKEIEIPFGAFDSETTGWTYTIPEGFTAKIEDGKIIVEKAESDDDRIRKFISETVFRSYGDSQEYLDVLAYLEKQKEQKPKMIQWTGKNLKEVIDFTGKSPRFDEWFKSWEEFENYVHSHGDILKLFCEDDSHFEVPVGAWIVKTPDGFNTPSLFKFVQKSPEWSEEDEAVANLILKELEEDKKDSPDYSKHFAWLIDWFTLRFKSLRPQPHWKPSEEQIEALERAIVKTHTVDDIATLAELRDNLKKL